MKYIFCCFISVFWIILLFISFLNECLIFILHVNQNITWNLEIVPRTDMKGEKLRDGAYHWECDGDYPGESDNY